MLTVNESGPGQRQELGNQSRFHMWVAAGHMSYHLFSSRMHIIKELELRLVLGLQFKNSDKKYIQLNQYLNYYPPFFPFKLVHINLHLSHPIV